MENKNEQLTRDAYMYADRLASMYPEEVGVVVNLVLKNLLNGCYWSFVRDSREFRLMIPKIEAHEKLDVTPIDKGRSYMVSIDINYLLEVLRNVGGNIFTEKDIKFAEETIQKHIRGLQKFMERGESGKIGIYNLNDVPRITVKGKTFPAYNITLWSLLMACKASGYKFLLGNEKRTAAEVSAHFKNVMYNLELAPSSNALFITITK